MKKTLLIAAVCLMGTAAFAQSGTGFGIKAGLSYNKNGDLISSVGDAGQNITEGAEGKAGYHFGFWGKLDFPKIYLRPELVYTRTQSNYDVSGESRDYDVSRLDLPVLLGYKLVGPLHVFAGPAFQYTLSNDLEGVNIDDVENDFTVGLNIGAGVNLGKLGLDVRYERGFSKNEANFISNNIADIEGRVDSRPSQVIFAASLKL
ncbi:PorT family protein [Flagellimonas sp. HMM57]|uniref:outer membrane beta-barrel protein n=1 Tax=unclassified Flagellimonas TaxID=2644544 RepID=UPI0013D5E3F2|nr:MULTISPECIES: outer membrane beta-barrel protein [unclassified Flagellimonas]MBS9462566.1 PorT family protein [Flagellimonas sp. 389]UII76417.1 PorT family protein [Flagellimonas sp. HMM57]